MFYLFVISTQNIRDALADWSEILHGG